MPDKQPRTLTAADLEAIEEIVRRVVREEVGGYEAATDEPPPEGSGP